MAETIKVLYSNNEGKGFAEFVEAPAGTDIRSFLFGRASREFDSYVIRVKAKGALTYEPVPADYVLNDGDKVSCQMDKVEGAASPA